ncbi:MAG: hypothetical protein ACREJ2_01420, partial [Planctomycetota bacterium]
ALAAPRLSAPPPAAAQPRAPAPALSHGLPQIAHFHVRIEPPTYTHLPVQENYLPTIAAPAGSRVTVFYTVSCDQPAQSWVQSVDPAGDAADGRRLSNVTEARDVQWPVDATVPSGPLAIVAQSGVNFTRLPLFLQWRDDLPPHLEAVVPPKIPRDADGVHFNLNAEDDYGLTRIECLVSTQPAAGAAVGDDAPTVRVEIVPVPVLPGQDEFHARVTIPTAALDRLGQDRLRLQVKAWDTHADADGRPAPNLGATNPQDFLVIEPWDNRHGPRSLSRGDSASGESSPDANSNGGGGGGGGGGGSGGGNGDGPGPRMLQKRGDNGSGGGSGGGSAPSGAGDHHSNYSGMAGNPAGRPPTPPPPSPAPGSHDSNGTSPSPDQGGTSRPPPPQPGAPNGAQSDPNGPQQHPGGSPPSQKSTPSTDGFKHPEPPPPPAPPATGAKPTHAAGVNPTGQAGQAGQAGQPAQPRPPAPPDSAQKPPSTPPTPPAGAAQQNANGGGGAPPPGAQQPGPPPANPPGVNPAGQPGGANHSTMASGDTDSQDTDPGGHGNARADQHVAARAAVTLEDALAYARAKPLGHWDRDFGGRSVNDRVVQTDPGSLPPMHLAAGTAATGGALHASQG